MKFGTHLEDPGTRKTVQTAIDSYSQMPNKMLQDLISFQVVVLSNFYFCLSLGEDVQFEVFVDFYLFAAIVMNRNIRFRRGTQV